MTAESELDYRQRIDLIHQALEIPSDYALSCAMPLQVECGNLADAGVDVFGRPALLEAETLQAWKIMQQAAAASGITLHMISAFRSAEYQKGIFERKLARGDSIQKILKVNAAPGFSEHHTGQAIDIGTDGVEHLNEAFEQSDAYMWLCGHAEAFGFWLTFPRDNAASMLYEPWHWRWKLPLRQGAN